MRKIIFTENQVKYILGEDFETYLPNSDTNGEIPLTSYGTEISIGDKNSNNDIEDTTTSDKIAHSITPQFSLFRHTSGLAENRINEENHELVNHQYNLGKNLNNKIDSLSAYNPNDRLLKNMSQDKTMSHGTAKKRKHDLEQMKSENPQRYKKINGDKLLNAIKAHLNADTNMSKMHKEIKKDILGQENVYQKQGGTKNIVNKRNNGNIAITYER